MKFKSILKLNLFMQMLVGLSLLSFIGLSLGGDYIHGLVHDHAHALTCDHWSESADAHQSEHVPEENAREECPLGQFLVQAFIVYMGFAESNQTQVQYASSIFQCAEFSDVSYSLPSLRAPPVG